MGDVLPYALLDFGFIEKDQLLNMNLLLSFPSEGLKWLLTACIVTDSPRIFMVFKGYCWICLNARLVQGHYQVGMASEVVFCLSNSSCLT